MKDKSYPPADPKIRAMVEASTPTQRAALIELARYAVYQRNLDPDAVWKAIFDGTLDARRRSREH